MALLLLGAAAVAPAAWSVSAASAPAVNAQEDNDDNDFVLVPLRDQAFGSIKIDDECLVTNRRELEGPVMTDGMLRLQEIMIATSACPEGSGNSDLETKVQVFSVLCSKNEALDTHALCDVKLVAPKEVQTVSCGAPLGLQGTLDLSWSDHPDPNVVGFNVYRSTVSAGPYVKVNTVPVRGISFRDTGLLPGTTYHYVVTAVDRFGNESRGSADVSGTTR